MASVRLRSRVAESLNPHIICLSSGQKHRREAHNKDQYRTNRDFYIELYMDFHNNYCQAISG